MNADTFELILSELENIDGTRLEALVCLREKLSFNSDNPQLIVTNSRQIAIGTELQIGEKISGLKEQTVLRAVVQSNTPNFLYVKMIDSTKTATVENFSSVSIKFRPMRQKKIYQFHASPQGIGANGLLRIGHSNLIKIVEEI